MPHCLSLCTSPQSLLLSSPKPRFFLLDHYNSFPSGYPPIPSSHSSFFTQQPARSFKTINQNVPLPSLTPQKGFSVHSEWNPNSFPGCGLLRQPGHACLWPHLLLLQLHYFSFLSLSRAQWASRLLPEGFCINCSFCLECFLFRCSDWRTPHHLGCHVNVTSPKRQLLTVQHRFLPQPLHQIHSSFKS